MLCVAGDVERDGSSEVIIGGRLPQWGLHLVKQGPDGTWARHLIDAGYDRLEAGGALVDVDGDGRLDLVAGGDWHGQHLYWWQCPKDPTQPWIRRFITQMPAPQSHDQLAADLDGDGRAEIYFWNQRARTLFVVPIPGRPLQTPWPGISIVCSDVSEEGLAVADVDGDGESELLAGQSWYKRKRDGTWQRHPFASGFVSPRLAVADFDGEGKPEIVLTEGDASLHGRAFGRAVRFFRPDDPTQLWPFEVLHDRLLDPHSLCVADLDGDGRDELFIGELGDPRGHHAHPPAQRVFFSRDGRLIESIIDRGIGCHEAKAVATPRGCGIVGKPYQSVAEREPRETGMDAVYLWSAEASDRRAEAGTLSETS